MHAHGDSPAHARVAGAAVRVLCGRVQYRKERAAAEEGMYVDVHEGRVRYSSPGTKDWLRRNISLARAHKNEKTRSRGSICSTLCTTPPSSCTSSALPTMKLGGPGLDARETLSPLQL